MRTAPGELDQLLAAICDAAGEPSLEWAAPPRPLTGGFWAQLWRVRVSGGGEELAGDLVARVMPEPAVAARETAVQRELADRGFPTPRVRLAAAPGPRLDRAWMLMDFVPGEPLLAGMSGPSALAHLPRLARTIPERLAALMSELHRIGGSTGHGPDDDATTLPELLSAQAAESGRPDLVGCAEWLDRHRPPDGEVVRCHGDLHPFNVLTDATGDTVLDWSSTRRGDPAFDVAFTALLLSSAPLDAPAALRPALTAAGTLLRRRFTAAYERLTDCALDDVRLDWFGALHGLRILTQLALWESHGELDAHPGHPFLRIRGPVAGRLERTTGAPVTTP